MLNITYSAPRRMLKRVVAHYARRTVPRHIAARCRCVGNPGLETIKGSLQEHFFSRSGGYLSTDYGQRDLTNHLTGRLERDRKTVIPWLESARPLEGSRVLEVGCGTGCSTVALAEQGAELVAVDLHEPALNVARKRCEVYELDVEFHLANAVEIRELFSGRHFDFVIFYACLEHMLCQERLTAIRAAWDLLSPNDFCCVVDTPNRLWLFDSHTSLLPFFSWLPDELAFKYARFSPRHNFRELYDHDSAENHLDFLRRGRGVSFHEFHLAIGRPVEQLNVVGSLSGHLRRRNLLRRCRPQPSLEARFVAILSRMYPRLHRGWFRPSLDLIIQKEAAVTAD